MTSRRKKFENNLLIQWWRIHYDDLDMAHGQGLCSNSMHVSNILYVRNTTDSETSEYCGDQTKEVEVN